MTSKDIANALQNLAPGAEWSLMGDSLSGLTWLDQTIARPTDDAINAEVMVLAARASIPQTVSPRQARLALAAAGLLDKVTAAVNAADQATQITWEFATEINRTDPLIATLGAALGIPSSQIDSLFVQAAKL